MPPNRNPSSPRRRRNSSPFPSDLAQPSPPLPLAPQARRGAALLPASGGRESWRRRASRSRERPLAPPARRGAARRHRIGAASKEKAAQMKAARPPRGEARLRRRPHPCLLPPRPRSPRRRRRTASRRSSSPTVPAPGSSRRIRSPATSTLEGVRDLLTLSSSNGS